MLNAVANYGSVAKTVSISQKGSFKGKNIVEWYEEKANDYFDESVGCSMEDKYPQLLDHIPEGGHILDAGCGSGRDTKAFLDKGYKVSAFDASGKLAAKASNYTGINVQKATFENYKSNEKFDGIWATASLLHVPKKDFEKSFANLADHLKPGGVMWVALKTGKSEEGYDPKGRFFNYVSEDEMKGVIAKHRDLELIDITRNENALRQDTHPFSNFIIRKK